MTKVDYYKAEVNYMGDFNNYDLDAWIEKAREKSFRCDCFVETKEEQDGFAKVIDGKYFVQNTFPCNKIATVQWAQIREEDDEE